MANVNYNKGGEEMMYGFKPPCCKCTKVSPRKPKKKNKPYKAPEIPDAFASYQPCVHLHFKTEQVDRDCLTHDQYLDLLATPKGYQWIGEVDCQNPELDINKPKKKKKKPKMREPIVIRPDGGDFAEEFVEDLWDVMSPDITDRLIDFLVNEFGMSAEEAEDFIDCKCNVGKKTVCRRKKSKPIIGLGPKHKWVKEFSDVFAKRIEQYIVSMLMTKRTPRVKRIAERILDCLCDLSGERTTLQNPKTKVQRTMVLISDRMALWIDDLMRDIDKPQKQRPSIMEEEESEEEMEPQEDEEEKEEEGDKGEPQKKEPPKETKKEPKPGKEEPPKEEESEDEDKEEEKQPQADEEQQEQQPQEQEETKQEDEEEPQQKEEVLQQAEKTPQETEKEEEVQEEKAQPAAEEPEAEEQKQAEVEEEQEAETREEEAEDKKEEEAADTEEKKEEEAADAEDKGEEEAAEAEAKGEEEAADEKETTEEEAAEIEEKPEEEAAEIEEAAEEETKPEEEEPAEEVEEESKEEEEEEREPSEKEPAEIKEEPKITKEPEKKPYADILDIVKEDIAGMEKGRMTDRQKAVKGVVDKRIEKLMAGVESADGLQREDIDDAASLVAHWVEQILGATEMKKDTAPHKGPGGAYAVKPKTGSTLEVHKLSSGTVAEVTAKVRGVEAPPRGRKMPASESPLNLKSAQEWADWASNIALVADEWGKWLQNTLTDAEKQLLERQRDSQGTDWKQWRDRAQTDAMKFRAEKERIKGEGKVWDKKINEKLKTQQEQEVEVRSTELSSD